MADTAIDALMQSSGSRPLARGLVGLAISALALAITFSRTDLGEVWTVLAAAIPVLVAATLGATCVDLACRTFRWRALLSPIKQIAFGPVLSYLLVGYLANNVLPARVGELVRMQLVGDREHISRAAALGTIIVERVVDIGVLAVIAVATVLLLDVHGAVAVAIVAGAGIAALLAIVLAGTAMGHRARVVRAWTDRLARWPRVSGPVQRLRTGLTVVGQPRVLAIALAWSALAWLATIGSFLAAAWATGIHPSGAEVALLASGTALATAIPAGPGYVGTFELAGVQIAQVLGLDPNHGLALTVLAHASAIVVTTIGGAAALLWLTAHDRYPPRTSAGPRATVQT